MVTTALAGATASALGYIPSANIRDKLNLLQPADLSVGSTPPVGSQFSFAVVDQDNSELVEFTIP